MGTEEGSQTGEFWCSASETAAVHAASPDLLCALCVRQREAETNSLWSLPADRLRAKAEGGLHDDAGRPASADLLQGFSIEGILHCF